MASINNHFSAIVNREQDSRKTIGDAFHETVASGLKRTGVDAAASLLKPSAASALKTYAQIFEYIDAPIATALQELLGVVGISANAFTAVQFLLQSDSVALAPHEKLGIPLWKYNLIEEIDALMKELDQLERTATFSYKLDRKRQIEQEIRTRLQQYRR
jgi:hypothetical protein